jgi:hypothetical protein
VFICELTFYLLQMVQVSLLDKLDLKQVKWKKPIKSIKTEVCDYGKKFSMVLY